MTWRREPLDSTILALLKASREKMLREEDLMKMLEYMYSKISYGDVLKSLLRLEVRGLIEVSLQKEGSRIIKLASEHLH